ncbi:integrase catalytic domain-containing protein [Trichonephila clavipes]|nr:integrase catalytic domain-containing protein [Trichonephila clavipes]
MLHEFRLINMRSENNETISFVYCTESFRSHWNVGAVYIAPKITIAGNIENGKSMGSGTTSEYFDSRVSVILVRAKSRVAPLKLLSIPRLELMACCVGARLVNSILKALNMPDLKVTLWSDSTTAHWWIKEYGNWSVFVANRVKEIRQLTQIQSWKYGFYGERKIQVVDERAVSNVLAELYPYLVGEFGKAICSDEAHFWLNGYVNKQNCRIWSEANPQVYVETPLHPEKLTVWSALCAGGIIGP